MAVQRFHLLCFMFLAVGAFPIVRKQVAPKAHETVAQTGDVSALMQMDAGGEDAETVAQTGDGPALVQNDVAGEDAETVSADKVAQTSDQTSDGPALVQNDVDGEDAETDSAEKVAQTGDGPALVQNDIAGEDAEIVSADDEEEQADELLEPSDRFVEKVGHGPSIPSNRPWERYVLRGGDLPRAGYGAPRSSRTRLLTWKTTCIPNEKVAFVKSWVGCMPDLKYEFYTDAGIKTFLVNYASKMPGMAAAVQKMDNATKWHGVKMAEMSRALLLEDRGGLAVDLDVTCLKSWDLLLDEHEALMSLEPRDHADGGIFKLYDQSTGVIEPLLSDWNSNDHVLSSIMAASRPHTKFFKQLAEHTVTTINDPGFDVEGNPVDNIGPLFHYNFLNEWFASNPDPKSGAVLANYLLQFNCTACMAIHHGGCTWCSDHYEPKGAECTDIRTILPADQLTVFDGSVQQPPLKLPRKLEK